ncbi:protein of unknown function, might be Protein TonB [Shewanella benthica]|uniref:Protein TonB n=1 Tax=Shewanella benthica TaxID=43661 RepID=A0A330M847_9GAMM|nr:energy transducer TonB [Shewanella benthica]SQH78165.1 protein of unknown function, might be Protein TonB [Shewanella benthica]
MNGTQLLLASMALALVTACGLNESQQLERELLINKGVKQYPSRCTRVDESQFEHHTHNHHPARTKIVREPKYPVNAKELGIEGYVKLEFDLSTEGKPINIHVLESAPAGIFDQAGIEALSTWLYQGEMLPCHAVQLNFNLPPERKP